MGESETQSMGAAGIPWMWTRSWRRNQKLLRYRTQMRCQRCGPRWGPLVKQRPAVGQRLPAAPAE
eukprot:2321308-Rhodomonas_salina.1